MSRLAGWRAPEIEQGQGRPMGAQRQVQRATGRPCGQAPAPQRSSAAASCLWQYCIHSWPAAAHIRVIAQQHNCIWDPDAQPLHQHAFGTAAASPGLQHWQSQASAEETSGACSVLQMLTAPCLGQDHAHGCPAGLFSRQHTVNVDGMQRLQQPQHCSQCLWQGCSHSWPAGRPKSSSNNEFHQNHMH